MSNLQILITTTLSSEETTIFVRDAHSQNILSSYKTPDRTVVSPKCIQIIDDFYLVCTYANTAILNVWSLAQKDAIHRRIILPKPNATCLIVSSDSNFIIVGIESQIYIWNLSTGRLLNVLKGHYGNITNLALTDDCSRLISAGQDTIVQLWDFALMIVPSEAFSVVNGVSSSYRPLKSMSLPYGQINDLYLTPGATATSGVFSVAFSKGYIILYLITGEHIASINLSSDKTIPRSIVMDRAQTRLYIGLDDGDIVDVLLGSVNKAGQLKQAPKLIDINIQFDPTIARPPPQLNYHQKATPKTTEPERIPADDHAKKYILKGHSAAVTCLSVGWDGHVIASGSLDKKIMLWDVRSHQCTKTIHHQGPISNIIFTGFLSGLTAFKSLDSQMNLELASSNVSTDISFKPNAGEKRSRNDRVRSSNSQLMKLPINPPTTIATELQRTVQSGNPFSSESKEYSTKNHNAINPVDYGTMIVDNPSTDFNVKLNDLSSRIPGQTIRSERIEEQVDEFKKKMRTEKSEDVLLLAAKELVQTDPIIDQEFIQKILDNFKH